LGLRKKLICKLRFLRKGRLPSLPVIMFTAYFCPSISNHSTTHQPTHHPRAPAPQHPKAMFTSSIGLEAAPFGSQHVASRHSPKAAVGPSEGLNVVIPMGGITNKVPGVQASSRGARGLRRRQRRRRRRRSGRGAQMGEALQREPRLAREHTLLHTAFLPRGVRACCCATMIASIGTPPPPPLRAGWFPGR